MLIDTHAHYDDAAFDEDRKQLINFLKEEKIIAIDSGASMASSKKAVELSHEFDNIYALVGVHPDDVGELTAESMSELAKLSEDKKVVGIGEIGLDYYWDKEDRELQKNWFAKQIELAKQVKLPICIHSRDAAADTLEIVKKYDGGANGGVVHCYSYGTEIAKEYLEMGFCFGIGGVLTYKNGRKLKEVAEYLPMDKVVLETDCPYLAPDPLRGKRNSSLNLKYVVSVLAQIKGIDEEEVINITAENARRVYTKLI